MSMNVSGSGAVSDINVTPFCDVCLVLLIIFMVVTPMLQKGVPVDLPAARNPQGESEADKEGSIILAVTKDKNVVHFYFGDKDRPLEALKDDLSEAYQRGPSKRVFLKGYKEIGFGEVKRVLKIVQDVGFKQIGLLAQHVDEKGMPVTGNAASSMAK